MIHLLRNQNIRDANPLLQSMFEDRKSIFIDLLDWDIPVVDDRFEMALDAVASSSPAPSRNKPPM